MNLKTLDPKLRLKAIALALIAISIAGGLTIYPVAGPPGGQTATVLAADPAAELPVADPLLPDPDPDPEPKPPADPEPAPKPDPTPVKTRVAVVEPPADPEPAGEPEPEPNPEPNPEPDPEPDPEPPVAETKPDPTPRPKPASKSEPTRPKLPPADPEPEPDSEPAPDPEPQPPSVYGWYHIDYLDGQQPANEVREFDWGGTIEHLCRQRECDYRFEINPQSKEYNRLIEEWRARQ